MAAKKFVWGVTLTSGIVDGMQFAQITSDDLAGVILQFGSPIPGGIGKPHAILTTDPSGNLRQYSPGLIYDREGNWDGGGGAAPLGITSTLYIGGEVPSSISHIAFHKILPTPGWISLGIGGIDTFTVSPATAGFSMGYCRIFVAATNRPGIFVDQQGLASITADMAYFSISGTSSIRCRINHDGFFMINQQGGYTEPPDGDLGNHEFAFWFDPTAGAASFNIKGKDSAGTVVRATLPLI